jgi:hypothetical protein
MAGTDVASPRTAIPVRIDTTYVLGNDCTYVVGVGTKEGGTEEYRGCQFLNPTLALVSRRIIRPAFPNLPWLIM